MLKIKYTWIFLLSAYITLLSCKPNQNDKANTFTLLVQPTLPIRDTLKLYKFDEGNFVQIASIFVDKENKTYTLSEVTREDDFYRVSCKGNYFDFPISANPKDTSYLSIGGSGDLLNFTIKGGALISDYNAFLAIQTQLKKKYDSLEVAAILAENMRNIPLRQNIDAQFANLDIQANQMAKDFVRSHQPSLLSAWITYSLDPKKEKSFMDSTSERLKPLAESGATNIIQFREYVENIRCADVGQVAPEIKLKSVDGIQVALSSLKGNVVLVDFWASWCGPCRKDNPNLVRIYEKYKSKGLKIFGVSLDTEHTKWKKAIEEDKISWIQVSDLKGWESPSAMKYGVDHIPFNFLIDKNGIIIAKSLHGPELEMAISKLLEKTI